VNGRQSKRCRQARKAYRLNVSQYRRLKANAKGTESITRHMVEVVKGEAALTSAQLSKKRMHEAAAQMRRIKRQKKQANKEKS